MIIFNKWEKKKGSLCTGRYGSKTMCQIQIGNGTTQGSKDIKWETYFIRPLPSNTEWHLLSQLQVSGHGVCILMNVVLCSPGVFKNEFKRKIKFQ